MSATLQIAGLAAMERELGELSKRGLGYAARDTVNSLAFEGRKAWQGEMRASLTLRNKFTERRALVVPARSTRIRGMHAILGHTEEYMARLESGGAERAAKRFRPIPTEVAAGQAKGSTRGGRKQAVRPSNIITRLGRRLPGGGKGRTRKARNARAIQAAIRKGGQRLALLDLGKRKGVFRIKGRGKRLDISMLYDLTHRSTPVPRRATLQRTLERVVKLGPDIAYRALSKQLTRVRGQG